MSGQLIRQFVFQKKRCVSVYVTEIVKEKEFKRIVAVISANLVFERDW